MTNKEAIKYLQQFYPHGGHSWLDAQRMEAIKMAIDALQEEPVSEDLEDEIGNYIENNFFGSETMGFFSNKTKEELNDKDVADIARHFAEWQKEQMMAKAIRGHVGQTINGMLRALSDETFGDMGFMAGDKVKLIIIKEN